jgi:indolepyruvate ferredoxin oxidoreductase beta subunit
METKNILIVGVGGQGTLLTSRILGNLAMNLGFDVKMSEVHGMAQRGGSVVTHVRFGSKVHSPLVEIGKADYILAFEKMEALRWSHYLKQNGVMVVNDQVINPMPVITGAEAYPEDIIERLKTACNKVLLIDAVNTAKQLGNLRVSNVVLLGVMAKYLNNDIHAWNQAIADTVPPKTIDVNKAAFLKGYNEKIQ